MGTESINPVVVGVDGTLASLRALDLAADEAMARVVPLVVLYTVEPSLDPTLPQHRRLLDLAVSQAQADHPGLAVSAELALGSPCDALVAWSRRACLLVLGHGHCDHESVAARVAERSSAPVIVYRPFARHARPDRRPVLVGVDRAEHGPSALAFAFEEAMLRGAPLSIVHVWSDADDDTAEEQRAATAFAEAVAAWSSRYADVPVRQEVLHGRAVGSVLAGASREAALVVVGAHHDVPGEDGGAVSRALIDSAGCPVAVVDSSAVSLAG